MEYKRGRLGRWRNDHAQLCAQALCLEERLGVTIERGYIFSFAQRRREEVVLDSALRTWTESLVADAHQLAQVAVAPAPIKERARCGACSLEPLCLPDEVRMLHRAGEDDRDEG